MNTRTRSQCSAHATATRTGAAHRHILGACSMLALLALASVPFSTLSAQTLQPKRTLTTGAAAGCDLAPAARTQSAVRDNAEARRLAATAQEAALVGDQTAARDAYVRASELNPADERVAYDLARTYEELSDTLPAIGAYCRYLSLAPAGNEANDVRARLARLVPRDARQSADDAATAFTLGLGFLDRREFTSAVRAFDEVVRLAPAAPEGYFNRGLARSAAGQRAQALEDLEVFRAGASVVEDRVATARAIDVLRRPVYSPTAAFFRGVLPGFGQFYTGRPVRGVFVLAAAAGAMGAAVMQQTTDELINYIDPNGIPAPYSVVSRERKYFVPGLAVAGGITLAGALEALAHARGSRRGASILDLSGAAAAGDDSFALSPIISRTGEVGFRLSLSFR